MPQVSKGQLIDAAVTAALATTIGINNAFDEDPPACYSCLLNGYDPSHI